MAMTILFIVQTRYDGSLSKRPVIFEGIDTLRYGSLLLSPRMTPEYFLRFFCFFFSLFFCLTVLAPGIHALYTIDMMETELVIGVRGFQ
jgi:hypothetical protein